MAELYRYAAFISYSSKDGPFAKRLHRALESYGIPSSLGKFDLIGGGKKNRIYPVFRDREELSAGQLGELVEANLRASAALIVVCSPNSAASPWVQKEIEYFASLGRSGKIFAIIADSAPIVDKTGSDATPACFPSALRRDAVTGRDLEPLAADARKGRDGFRNAWLKIVAGIVGVSAGQLVDRDRKRRGARRMQFAAVALAALLAVGAAGGLIYARQMHERSQQLAELARRASEEGNYDRAARYALAGLADADWPLLGYDAAAAEAELRHAVSGPLIMAFRADDGSQFRTATFSADGRQIITSSWSPADSRSSLRVWETVSGAAIGELKLAPNSGFLKGGLYPLVVDMDVSSDGRKLALAAPDPANGGVRIWSLAEGRQLSELKTSTTFTVDLSPDGSKILVTRLMDDAARIFDATTAREIVALRGHTVSQVSGAVFSHDGRRALTAGADATARIWDVANGRELLWLTGHTDAVTTAVFSGNDAYVATASEDGTARLWDARTGKVLGSIVSGTVPLTGVAFSSDGVHIAIAASDGTITIYDLKAGAAVRRLLGDGAVLQVRFSPDGSAILAVTGACVRLWSVVHEQALIPAERNEAPVMIAYAAAMRGDNNGAFSPDGALLATVSDDRSVHVWGVKDGREIARMTGHLDIVWGAAFSPGGDRIVTTSSDRTARIWDAATGWQLLLLGEHAGMVTSAEFSPDGRRVVTTADDDEPRVWDASGGQQLLTLRGGRAIGAAFSPDGKRILTAGGMSDPAGLWDATTGSRIAEFEGGRRAAFSHDGSMFVTTGHEAAVVWDTATAQEIARLPSPRENVWDAAFSSDGRWIVTASEDGAVRVWSLPGGREVMLLRHSDVVLSARFSPDGRRVVTTSLDGAARLWDVATGRQIQIIGGLYGVVRRAEFSPDGESVVTAAMDRTSLVTDVYVTTESRRGLIELTCTMGPLSNGNDRFTGDELERTPVLGAAGEVRACSPPNVLARLSRMIGADVRPAARSSPPQAQ